MVEHLPKVMVEKKLFFDRQKDDDLTFGISWKLLSVNERRLLTENKETEGENHYWKWLYKEIWYQIQ